MAEPQPDEPLAERVDPLLNAVAAEPGDGAELAPELSAAAIAADVRRFLRATRPALAVPGPEPLAADVPRRRRALAGAWRVAAAALLALGLGGAGTALLRSGSEPGPRASASDLPPSDSAALLEQALEGAGGENWYSRIAQRPPLRLASLQAIAEPPRSCGPAALAAGSWYCSRAAAPRLR